MLKQITSTLLLAQVSTMKINDIPEHEFVGIQSDPICSSAGCTQYNHPKMDPSKKIKRDYFVPNFGRDSDILGTINSAEVAEK